jgi:iron complex outermembrane receptor protein
MRAAIATLMLLASLASADEQAVALPDVIDPLRMLPLEDLMRIEVAAATKIELPLREAPAVECVVAREQIQNYGWNSINDVLYRQPGFAPAQDYERRTVAARGLFEGWNNNHLLLLIDGVPMNDNQYGTAYTWETTPMVLIRSLEIIRGPGSALYGTNATNGVIAINTRSPSLLEPTAEASLRIGNANTEIFDAVLGRAWSKVSLLVAYNHFHTDGNEYSSYDGSGRTDAAGNLAKFTVNDHRTSDYLFAKVTLYDQLTLQLHYQYWHFETGHGWLWMIPDQPETMREDRELIALSWKPKPLFKERFTQEYTLRYQRHGNDWNMRYYYSGFSYDVANGDGTTTTYAYPNGLTENLSTDTHDLFLRAQWGVRIWRELRLIGGVENTTFIYTGDRAHNSNVDLNNGGTYMPYGDGLFHPQGPWFEYVRNKPVDNVGVFLEGATGRLFHRVVSLTAGLRYDLMSFDYVDITDAMRKIASKRFDQLSPRVALVLVPWRDLSLKILYDQAFRAPAPSEMFGANTYSLASNIKQLKPEQIQTVTAAFDLSITSHVNVRADWFYEIFDNQIAYSVANANLSTNVYSRTITGVEAEVLFDVAFKKVGWLSGFFNYTFSHLLDEKIQDNTIAVSKDLTWAPAHVFNIGLNFASHGVSVSVQGHYQGEVLRRSSDILNADGTMNTLRPRTLPDYFTADARVSYQLARWARLGIQLQNLANTTGYLVKNNNYPFDYRIEGIRVLGTLDLEAHTAM